MKINFSEIELTDLEGNILKEAAFHKTIAGLIYSKTQNLDLIPLAPKINQGEEVDFRDSELIEIERLIADPANGVFAFARKAFKEFVKKKQEDKPNNSQKPAKEK